MPSLPRVRIDHRYLLSAGVVMFVAFRYVPWSSVASGLYAAIAISAALAGVSGIRRDRPAERSAWVALVAGIALSAIVELARLLAVTVGGLDSLKTSLDFVFVIASIAQLGGIVGLISERSTGRSRNSWLDAAAIGVAVFLTMWGTIEQTIRARASSSTFEWISQLGKPILGGALIVMSVRLLLGEGRWRRSFMMLALGYLLHMANDIVLNLAPDYAPEGAVDALRALGFALIGASLLHPDRLVGPRPVPTLQARRDVNEVLAIQGVVVVALIGVIGSTILEYTPMSTVVTWGVGGLIMLALNRTRIYGLLREVGDASITEHSRRLTALVEHSHEMIGVADAEGIVRFVSPAVEDMTGLAPSWWIGKHFPTIATQTVKGFEEFLLQVEHLRRAESASWQGEYSPRPGAEPRVIRFTIVNHLATPEVDGWVITARNVTDEARLTNELRHQALHDSLTGLPNRELLADRIGHALDRGRRTGEMALAVLLVDLDDFKSVNDSLGHDTGDELLKTVAGRLSDAIRPGDTVARLGGDEFAVLLEQTEEREALIVANRIMEGLALPLRVGDTDFAVQASIGVVASCRVTDPVELLRAADIAMYAAKRDGKGRVSMFRDHMHDEAKIQLTLRMDLAGALQRGELSLAYQPIVDTAAGEVRGFEALLRWQHPERGAIPPNDFIPIAEQTGVITPIGAWVLRSACAEAARWANRPGQPYVSVNVSALQLRDLEFVTTVADALRDTHLAPERLLLEITESMLINEAALTREALSQLRALGVRVAIDDFGTGYSSLAYLRELAVDVVKIDRSFIRDLAVNADHRALTSTMLALADGLSMTAIAEGVETDVELSELRHLGCEFAQGFLFSRPIPAAAIDPLLDEYEAHATRSAASDATVPDPS